MTLFFATVSMVFFISLVIFHIRSLYNYFSSRYAQWIEIYHRYHSQFINNLYRVPDVTRRCTEVKFTKCYGIYGIFQLKTTQSYFWSWSA